MPIGRWNGIDEVYAHNGFLHTTGKQHFLGPIGSDRFILLPKQDIQLLTKNEDFYDFILFGKTDDTDEGKQKQEGLR